jgi:DNA-binding MarR family transcriptional regulator
LHRKRSKDDERKVEVWLSDNGILLQEKAADIPIRLSKNMIPDVISVKEVAQLKELLDRLIDHMNE